MAAFRAGGLYMSACMLLCNQRRRLMSKCDAEMISARNRPINSVSSIAWLQSYVITGTSSAGHISRRTKSLGHSVGWL